MQVKLASALVVDKLKYPWQSQPPILHVSVAANTPTFMTKAVVNEIVTAKILLIVFFMLVSPSYTNMDFKTNMCVAGKRTRNHVTTKADVFLAGLASQLTVIVAFRINRPEFIRSLKPLVA